MAAFEQPPISNILPSAPSERVPTSRRALPNGPCNYRDLTIGSCGCNQFWDKGSAELHDASTENRPSSDRSTWCVCGHHACFHQTEAQSIGERGLSPLAPGTGRTHIRREHRSQLYPAQAHSSRGGIQRLEEDQQSSNGSDRNYSARGRGVQPAPRQQTPQQRGNSRNGTNQDVRDEPSHLSTSCLPSIPSLCRVDVNEPGQSPARESRQMGAGNSGQSDQSLLGLGLLLNTGNFPGLIDRQQSIPCENVTNKATHGPYSDSQIPSTKANSVVDEPNRQCSPFKGGLEQIVEYNRNPPQLELNDTIPNSFNPEDYIQSATEVATPSIANTPDLRAADQAVQDTRNIVDTLSRLQANAERNGMGSDTRPASSTSGGGPQLLLTNSPAYPQEQLQQALRSASPQLFQRIASYLGPLHNLLNSMPNVANTIRDMTQRIESLENNSFNHVQPEDMNQALEVFDGRVLDLEHRMDDHDKFHAAIDADQSSNNTFTKRRFPPADSFTSNHSSSAQSMTSSALIVAAIDRNEMQTEFDGIKDRLGALEAAAMPTPLDPWHVEVVFLPWGRELRGIWYSADDPMHDHSTYTTQDAEEWTQARSLRSSSRNSLPVLPSTDVESGWSSQAISQWADTMDEWLSPKACGSNNLVYKRLESRGFVRNVTLKGANAKDIQAAISSTFSGLLDSLEYSQNGDIQPADTNDHVAGSYGGLKAAFIPLRKVLKSSRLRFLTPAEMTSSALWSAHFLASGIMMRVSGGLKRLYVTQRDAYLQQESHSNSFLSWQRLRELPRFHADVDTPMEGNDDQNNPHVPEADAKEACWAFYPAYDPPVSTTSSFNSNHSTELSLRPAEQRQWTTPSPLSKTKQPISPISEFPRRPVHRRNRTASTSVVEDVLPNTQASTKRRLYTSFDHHTLSSRRAQDSQLRSSSRSAPSATTSKLKRRRLTHSPSPHPTHHSQPTNPQQTAVRIWTNNTPRRSREPPSPFYSSHPDLPRSNSDVTSRSQKSCTGVVAGKNTPFAYATPHSGLVGKGFQGYAGGDTEADSSSDEEDEGEDEAGSWHGVEGDENENVGEAMEGSGSEDELAAAVTAGRLDTRRGGDELFSFEDEGEDSGFGDEDEEDEEYAQAVADEEEEFIDGPDGSEEEED